MGTALPAAAHAQIVAKADGIPLFLEELTKTVSEAWELDRSSDEDPTTDAPSRLIIPPTLQDALMARLDRLGAVKSIAQIGAVIGCEFSYTYLAAVTGMPEMELRDALQQLAAAEILYRLGQPPDTIYRFKHALVQDVAYTSLLNSQRRQHHRHIATILEQHFPETVENKPELLAHHYMAAELHEPALQYCQKAAQRALKLDAHREAAEYLYHVLELLQAFPDTPERLQVELDLQATLGRTLTAIQGHANPEVERAYNRALALYRQVGHTPHLFRVLHGLAMFYVIRPKFRQALDLGQQLVAIAEQVQEQGLLLEAHLPIGMASYYLGELSQAQKHLEQTISLYHPQQHDDHNLIYELNPCALSGSYAALVLWHRGYADQALAMSQQTLALARQATNPHDHVWSLMFASILHYFRREAATALALAEEANRLATEQGFSFVFTQGQCQIGWALAEIGDIHRGLSLAAQGTQNFQATGAETAVPLLLGQLVEMYIMAGQPETALDILAEAVAARTQERIYEAELYRLQGMLFLMQERATEEVESCYQQALISARGRQDKAHELRAAISLSRL